MPGYWDMPTYWEVRMMVLSLIHDVIHFGRDVGVIVFALLIVYAIIEPTASTPPEKE